MEPRFQQAGQPAEGSPRHPPRSAGARAAPAQRRPPRPAPLPAGRVPPPRTPSRRRCTLFNVLLLLCPRGKTLTSDTQMCESLNCMRGQSTPLSGKFKNMTSDSLCDCCGST